MTLTSSAMEWLAQNRRRSYPMERDGWREMVSPESGLDCVLLDALAFNNDPSGHEELVLSFVDVGEARTIVGMTYGDRPFTVELSGGETSGEKSFERVRMAVQCGGSRMATISLAFSSHAYIMDAVAAGRHELGCRALKSRVVGPTDGMGVDMIVSNGSSGVEGHGVQSHASGDVVLEDGYRTSPVVHNGKVVVRVGNKYGLNPCHYDFGEAARTDCRVPMFFFCGQNAINGGNVVMKGGKGIVVTQGGRYVVKSGTCAGKSIPCVEVVAGSELLDIYKPSKA